MRTPSLQKALRVDVHLELDGALLLRRLRQPVAQIGREVVAARRFHENPEAMPPAHQSERRLGRAEHTVMRTTSLSVSLPKAILSCSFSTRSSRSMAPVSTQKKARPSRREIASMLGATPRQIARELQTFSRSTRFLSSNYSRLLEQHPNAWLGIYRGKLYAAAKSFSALMSKLKKQGVPSNQALVQYMDASGRKLILSQC